MKAAVLTSPKTVLVKEMPSPVPKPGEVIVQPTLAGICGSDYSLFMGKFNVPLPIVPGHEAVGKIVEVGKNVSSVSTGQRVTIQPNFSCRICHVCRGGYENLCPSKIRLGIDRNGVFAQYVAVPADSVWPLPDDIKDDVAVFVEPLAVAMHGVALAPPGKNQRILIFGSGVIGLLTLQIALARSVEMCVCDIIDTRLELAKNLGATQAFDTNSPFDYHYNSFDIIYEASGSPDALSQAIHLAAPGGKIVLFGLPGQQHPVLPDLIVRKGLKIFGSMIYTNEFPETIEILRKGQVQTNPLLSHRLLLEDLGRGLKDFPAKTRIKMVLEI